MKKLLSILIAVIMVMSLLTVSAFAENTDPMAAFEAFLQSHGKTGVYSAQLSGGDGTFSMMQSSSGDKILCSIVQYQDKEEYREGFDFTITITDLFDGEYTWVCNTEDANGTTKSRGTMSANDNCNTVISCTEYTGDAYIQNSIIENAAIFRNDLIRAIANDLNYYFDESLDFFGFNPQFLCPDGHAFGEWVYQKNAKLNVNGTEKRTCSNCFAIEEREKEGSMLTPQPVTPEVTPETQTPVTTPEATPETQAPVVTPEPEEEIEYQFEHELDDGDDEGDEKKPTLPPYVIPVVIGVLAVIVVGVVLFLVMSKRKNAGREEYEQESDVFTADDDF